MDSSLSVLHVIEEQKALLFRFIKENIDVISALQKYISFRSILVSSTKKFKKKRDSTNLSLSQYQSR